MPTTKTTVYLDAHDYHRLRVMAEREGRPAAELVREAVREYTLRRRVAGSPKSIGAGRSGRGDLADRAEDLLGGMGRDS